MEHYDSRNFNPILMHSGKVIYWERFLYYLHITVRNYDGCSGFLQAQWIRTCTCQTHTQVFYYVVLEYRWYTNLPVGTSYCPLGHSSYSAFAKMRAVITSVS